MAQYQQQCQQQTLAQNQQMQEMHQQMLRYQEFMALVDLADPVKAAQLKALVEQGAAAPSPVQLQAPPPPPPEAKQAPSKGKKAGAKAGGPKKTIDKKGNQLPAEATAAKNKAEELKAGNTAADE